MDLKYFISKFKNIGALILNKEGQIIYKNHLADRYNYYFENILISLQQKDTHFCLLDFPAEISSFIFQDSTVILIKPMDDFVRLYQEKESLQEVRQELNEVINSSFDGIVIADYQGVIIHQNPAYEKITGLSTKELIGKSLKDLEDENVINKSASLKAIDENQEITIIQKVNTGSTILVSAAPIRDKNGNIKKIVNNVRDLSELNQLETEINKLEAKNQQINEELEILKQHNDVQFSIIAHSDSMKDVLDRALRVAYIDSSVIVQGPSGVGKEKIVELIHQTSIRKEKPLIKVNCGAIPESLLESELFGYAPGSFTGANQKGKTGLFEAAHEGTIFLDEIGEMNKDLQVKLLRVIQEREITRIGDTKPIPIDIRIIAATHRDLAKMVEANDFREDLYYRLNVIPIHIPALKDRKDDIIPFILHFLKNIEHKYGITKKFSNEALEIFKNHSWPGNVRELQNLVERVALMSVEPEITENDIQKELQIMPEIAQTNLKSASVEPLKTKLENIEAEIIKETVEKFPSIRKAATALKVDQSTLVRKMKKYNIDK
ncbi:sigma 54-interacting transcriptional regulator [Oceanobacillus oncorhynchi subsp. oncorhynchi]|uniref:sigma-54 interaction domain-containing protein n=1 Tax=Oceanobacillus oncorhynchi TaxID=545501 RepID=UPI0031DB1DEE